MIKEQILKILGENHTTPCVFNNEYQEVRAIYTYKNNVYCLNQGRDFEFDEVSLKGQQKILQAIEKTEFRKDKTFQA